MRKVLALGCCALYLVFGFVAGAAHLHESAEHHQESRGLHLDHAHLNDSDDHGHGHDHDRDHGSHDDGETGEARLDARCTGHRGGDVVYLSASAVRSLDSSLRSMPAIVSVGTTIEPVASGSHGDARAPGQPRDPPRKIPPRLRAPPA